MFRVILILLVVIGAVMTIPALRQRASVVFAPVIEKCAPHLSGVTDPLKKVKTGDKESEILGALKQEHIQGRQLPEDDFAGWLKAHQFEADGWGSQYYMLQRNDSLFVGSPGPDGKRGTPDDVTSGMPWERVDTLVHTVVRM